MAEGKHEHGKMEIEEHEKTFAAFVRISAWVIGGVLVFLIFLYAIAG